MHESFQVCQFFRFFLVFSHQCTRLVILRLKLDIVFVVVSFRVRIVHSIKKEDIVKTSIGKSLVTVLAHRMAPDLKFVHSSFVCVFFLL